MPHHAHTLTARAHGLRSSVTLSEQKPWQELRSSKLGVPFRRPVVLLNRFIADFFARSAKLAVEVDGGYHDRRRKLASPTRAEIESSHKPRIARSGCRRSSWCKTCALP